MMLMVMMVAEINSLSGETTPKSGPYPGEISENHCCYLYLIQYPSLCPQPPFPPFQCCFGREARAGHAPPKQLNIEMGGCRGLTQINIAMDGTRILKQNEQVYWSREQHKINSHFFLPGMDTIM